MGAEVIKVERPGTGDVVRQWDSAVRGLEEGGNGQGLLQRGELLERSCAHVCDTGGMRRAHLRGDRNIL